VIDEAVRKRALFREVNGRIRDVSRRLGFDVGGFDVFCECTRADCTLRVQVTGALYDEIVADGKRYIVATEHEKKTDCLAAEALSAA
jgi:hypothetical protein